MGYLWIKSSIGSLQVLYRSSIAPLSLWTLPGARARQKALSEAQEFVFVLRWFFVHDLLELFVEVG
jgi:hypothetical protein